MPPLAISETATRGVHAHGPHARLHERFTTKGESATQIFYARMVM